MPSVLLVDDHPVVLKGLRELLEGSAWQVVADEVVTGQGCLEAAARTQPDIVLLDLRLPDMLGPEVCRRLREAASGVRVVVLTGFDDEELLRACLAEGAAGILLKDVHDLDLAAVLDRVMGGEAVLDARLECLADEEIGGWRGPVLPWGLTPREYDVLRLVARGMTSAEIAEELFLSQNTVRSYVQSILAKTKTHTRIEALTEARRLRLI